jgi:hypothetical protein
MLLAISHRQRDTAPLSAEQEHLLDDWIAGHLPSHEADRAAELTKLNKLAAERDVLDTVELPSQRGKCYRGGFRNNFWPSCHAANCALMSSWATASDL